MVNELALLNFQTIYNMYNMRRNIHNLTV